MLDLPNENTDFISKIPEQYIANNYVIIFGLLQQNIQCRLYQGYIRHQMSASYFLVGESYDIMIYSEHVCVRILVPIVLLSDLC